MNIKPRLKINSDNKKTPSKLSTTTQTLSDITIKSESHFH